VLSPNDVTGVSPYSPPWNSASYGIDVGTDTALTISFAGVNTGDGGILLDAIELRQIG
jgi:hypothetical protein